MSFAKSLHFLVLLIGAVAISLLNSSESRLKHKFYSKQVLFLKRQRKRKDCCFDLNREVRGLRSELANWASLLEG